MNPRECDLLLIEKDPRFGNELLGYLQEEQVTVHWVESLEMAVSVLKKLPIHLIVLDLKSMGPSEEAFFKELKGHRIKIPLLVCCDKELLQDVKKQGCGLVEYLLKPFQKSIFLEQVHRLLIQII